MHGRYHPAWFFIPIVLAGLFPWSPFLVQAIRYNLPATWKERHEHRDAIFLILWAGLVFLFFSASSSKLPPYILPVFPPLALLIGRYLADAWDCRDFPGICAGYHILLAAAVALGALFLIAPYMAPQEITGALGLYRYTLALTLVAGAATAWTLARYRDLRQAFLALAGMSVLFLVQVNAAAPRVDTKSIKPLALLIKPLLKPGDEVAAYSTYYQDLPVYLEKRIIVVDWKGELEFGTTVENTKQWMTDYETFWKQWQEPGRIFMMTTRTNYENLRKNSKIKIYPFAENQRNIVLCNKEVTP